MTISAGRIIKLIPPGRRKYGEELSLRTLYHKHCPRGHSEIFWHEKEGEKKKIGEGPYKYDIGNYRHLTVTEI